MSEAEKLKEQADVAMENENHELTVQTGAAIQALGESIRRFSIPARCGAVEFWAERLDVLPEQQETPIQTAIKAAIPTLVESMMSHGYPLPPKVVPIQIRPDIVEVRNAIMNYIASAKIAENTNANLNILIGALDAAKTLAQESIAFVSAETPLESDEDDKFPPTVTHECDQKPVLGPDGSGIHHGSL